MYLEVIEQEYSIKEQTKLEYLPKSHANQDWFIAMANIYSVDDENTSNEPMTNTNLDANNSDAIFIDLINLVVCNDLMVIYLSREWDKQQPIPSFWVLHGCHAC